VLIVNPTDSDAVVPAVIAANAAGVPVIAVDRGVGARRSGRLLHRLRQRGRRLHGAAEFICDMLDGSGPVVELEGIPGVSATRERGQGFNTFMSEDCPGIEIVARQTANFNRAEGLSVMENILVAQPEIDAVFAHNDEMALGALQAIEASGRDILVVGFDATDDAVAPSRRAAWRRPCSSCPRCSGSQAVEAANQVITEGPPAETVNIAVPLQLVTRPPCSMPNSRTSLPAWATRTCW
jgi:ribose transport system substrate-binding protein